MKTIPRLLAAGALAWNFSGPAQAGSVLDDFADIPQGWQQQHCQEGTAFTLTEPDKNGTINALFCDLGKMTQIPRGLICAAMADTIYTFDGFKDLGIRFKSDMRKIYQRRCQYAPIS